VLYSKKQQVLFRQSNVSPAIEMNSNSKGLCASVFVGIALAVAVVLYAFPVSKPFILSSAIVTHDVRRPQQPNSDVFIVGDLHDASDLTAKYAVYSSTTGNSVATGFAFYLPLTAMAWQRIGYRSLVVIIGTVDQWRGDPVLSHVLTSHKAVVVFLKAAEHNSVMISQTSRIFVANILQKLRTSLEDFYLVTSDTDLWPIAKGFYDLPENRSILSLNSDCCGAFTHDGHPYKMIPMANIGAMASTWSQLTSRWSMTPATVPDIVEYLVKEFGQVANKSVHKGFNDGWFMDQNIVSILVSDWDKSHPGERTINYRFTRLSKTRSTKKQLFRK
jgi:hypothetical protein